MVKKLEGKVHIYVGEADNYYLNNAVYLAEEFLKGTKNPYYAGEVDYGPLSDKEFLESVSSLNKVDKIQVPMFIGHGFNDPRVPVEEAMQLAVALKQRGRNPRVFIAPDEGHGFVKLDNRIYFNERVASFLEETIGKSAPQAMSNP